MFANDNYLDKPQNTELKRIIINFIKEFKEFIEDTKNQLNEIKKKEFKESKCLSDAQENTNMWLKGMIKTIHELRT